MSRSRRKHSPSRRKSELAKAFEGFMEALCVGHGFCGSVVDERPRHVTEFIPQAGEVSSLEFARWVLMAEGVEPDYHHSHLRLIKELFEQRLGDAIDASKLRSECASWFE